MTWYCLASRPSQTHLCLVATATTLKGVGLQVRYGNEATEIADVDFVGIGDGVESLVQELRRPVSYLTVPLHFSKSQPPITKRVESE